MQIANDENVSVFGTSAKYLSALEKEGAEPRLQHSFTNLRTILSTGSPLAPESYDYVHKKIKNTVQISSISGGTDIVSCFALGSPMLPVYRGELQCRGLGMAVEVWNSEGRPIRGEPGELVCTKSFPSKPVYFWNDPDGQRYHDAYFSRYDNIWCHGDWAEITDNGGIIISGRSDTILNPGGVRIGTAEIYREVEKIPAVLESIAVGQAWEGDVRIILFVVLRKEKELTDSIKNEICQILKRNASPRHVPAKIIKVTDIPRTRSGKITEIVVKDLIHKRPISNKEAISNPEIIEEFKSKAELLNIP
jgi:acetoacetyl-CoA synthetase